MTATPYCCAARGAVQRAKRDGGGPTAQVAVDGVVCSWNRPLRASKLCCRRVPQFSGEPVKDGAGDEVVPGAELRGCRAEKDG